MVANTPPGAWSGLPVGLVGVAALETAGFAAVCWRSRTVPRWAAAIDFIVTAAIMWPGALVFPQEHQAGLGPTYTYLIVSIVATGLAPWPPLVAVGAGAIAGAAAFGGVLDVTAPPDRSGVPDAATPVTILLLAWVIAASLRAAARQVDDRRHRTAGTAARIARERERARQADALRKQLVAVMDHLADGAVVRDPKVVGWLRSEATWLRDHVTTGSPETSIRLLAGLHALVTERSPTGPVVHMDLPVGEPPLSVARVHALLGAIREALTNVVKHSGVSEAAVRVESTADRVTVTVSDAGRGFDPRSVGSGIGLSHSISQRLAEAGGHASVESSPGGGTRVLLRVPTDP
jgi:hypothetical protein